MKQISGVENKSLIQNVRFNFNSSGDRYRTVYAGIPRYFNIDEGELPLWFLTQNFKKWKSVLSDNRIPAAFAHLRECLEGNEFSSEKGGRRELKPEEFMLMDIKMARIDKYLYKFYSFKHGETRNYVYLVSCWRGRELHRWFMVPKYRTAFKRGVF